MSSGILVAREESGAKDSAQELRELGYVAWPAPVSRLRFAPHALPRSGLQALAFTSRHGVRAFIAANAWRDVPVFAVGQVTARALHQAGFSRVFVAAGEGQSLLDLLRGQLSPKDGQLVHVGADRLQIDIASQMEAAGFAARHVPMYRTRALSALPTQALGELRAGRIGTILLYSADGARVLSVSVEAGNCGEQARRARCVCLSANVAKSARIWGWSETLCAPEPTQSAMFSLLAAV